MLNVSQELSAEADEQKTRWIFRGESQFSGMKTRLERACLSVGDEYKAIPDRERRILREFKRRVHHYIRDVPHQDDLLEWLALMQHYGAPTRLLDWTYSFFVAVYFAVERSETKTPCVVWALRMNSLDPNDRDADQALKDIKSSACIIFKKYLKDGTHLQDSPWLRQLAILKYLFKHPEPLVLAVNPFRLNERLTIQQGVFLMPGDVSRSFEENLRRHGDLRTKLIQYEIHTGHDIRRDILRNLHSININRTSLFPGLEGFAESLKTRLAFPESMSRHVGGQRR